MTGHAAEGNPWEARLSALRGALVGRGLRSVEAARLLKKLVEVGDLQLVVEGVSAVLLDESFASGAVPANAGITSRDLGLAVEAAIRDVVNAYHFTGNPVTSRGAATCDDLVSEMCKQWIRSFSHPLAHTLSLRGTLSDPEVQDRLTVVALRMRELILEKMSLREEVSPAGYHLDADDLEPLCREASLAMFTAFERPNETNHELIHGRKSDAR